MSVVSSSAAPLRKQRLRADADGLRLTERRDGNDLDSVLLVESVDEPRGSSLAVAEVRAEPRRRF